VGFDARLSFDIGLGCTGDAQCNDGNACTVDACVSGRCQNAQQNTCAVAVSAGWDHSCAVEADGRVACWGANNQGQLGDGTQVDRLVPTFVPGVTDAVVVKGGGFHQTCVLRATGGVLCWGENGFGELGDGTTVQRLAPVTAVLPRPAISIDIGGDDGDFSAHACAVLDDHTVWCWGSNQFGTLGDGTTTSRVTPAAVPGLTNAVSVSVGGASSCALFSSGRASCWGNNSRGQLGSGDPSIAQSNVPVPVAGVTNAAALGVGFNGMIQTSTGSVLSWGQNQFDGVGDGTNIDRFSPVLVPNISSVVAIGAGSDHSCVVHASGAASCWGQNLSGDLGDGTTVDSTLPVSVVGLSGVKAIAGGRFHSCAVKSDGSVWCWGRSARGSLGDGTLIDHSTPVRALL
jgi:alpha-tubulin suppressor-like RCC1 family protein